MKNSFLNSAKRTLKIESEGIEKLIANLDESFDNFCDALMNCKGRVITLGVGKSGHIANKVSATLSSTGSSSFFINAAEALHGDLGSITSEDSVIVRVPSGFLLKTPLALPLARKPSPIPSILPTSVTGCEVMFIAWLCNLLSSPCKLLVDVLVLD